MKKPEKLDYMGEICIRRFDPTVNSVKIEYFGKGANEMWDKMEAYIKENYIRKDSLPSEEEIGKIIENVESDGLGKINRSERLAKAIIKAIKGDK